MSKKTTTKAKAPKATKSATPGVQVKKDAKGRFWLVAKDGGEERGPFASTKEALDAKATPANGAPATESKATKVKPAKKAKEPNEKKLSAIDAAAQVLAASKQSMTTKEMIEAMEKKALWTSPGGKTPHATLCSAIIREIAVKGKEARFTKTERGKFAAK